MLSGYTTQKKGATARYQGTENTFKAQSTPLFFFPSSLHKNKVLFQTEPFASFFVFDCMFVCFVQLQQNKGSGFHSATVKKLSNVPTALRMPTNESKACCKADKEGLMPTSKPLTTITGDLPASLALSKTKWRRTTRYHNMAALSGSGHCSVT